MGDGHTLCKAAIDLNVRAFEVEGVGADGAFEIVAQALAFGKIELKMAFLANPKEVVKNFQPFITGDIGDCTAQSRKGTDEVALNLTKPIPGFSNISFYGGNDKEFLLNHVAHIAGTGNEMVIFLLPQIVMAIVFRLVQDAFAKTLLVHVLAGDAEFGPAVGGDARIDNTIL